MGSLCLQADLSTNTSLLENQHQTRRDGDQSSGTSLDGRLPSTARTTPASSESARLTESPLAAQAVVADHDWEVRDIIGRKDVGGEVYYLVDWRQTLVPESALVNAKELVDEFEPRLRAQLESKRGRRGPGLTRGERATVVADAPGKIPQKGSRGRRKQV